LTLIPLLTSNDDTQPAEVDMGMELFDVPKASKLRVATGTSSCWCILKFCCSLCAKIFL